MNVNTPSIAGTDDTGNPTSIQFLIVSSPGQQATITITEVIAGSGN